MKVLMIVAVALAAMALVASAEDEQVFRRTTADIASLQDSVTMLEEEVSSQRNHIEFVGRLVNSVADYNVVDAVAEDVRFLVERSLQLADADELAELTETLTEAASRAQELRLVATTHAAAVPALASTSARALKSALAQENSYFRPTLSLTDSLETRYRAMRENLNVAIDGLEGYVDRYNDTLDYLEDNLPAATEAVDFLLEQAEAYESIDFPALVSSLRQFHDFRDSRTRAHWWWNKWFTYSRQSSWYASNNNVLFGGVNPSSWSDGGATVSSMSKDMDVLRTLFVRRGSGGPNAMIYANEWYYYTSTNGQHTGVLLRIRNNTPNNINWSTYFYYSSYGSWSEYASVSINGNQIWSTSTNSGPSNNVGVTVTFPPDSVSTVIYVFGSGYPSNTRCTVFAFYNSCLNLPTGLTWEDDFSVATALNEPNN